MIPRFRVFTKGGDMYHHADLTHWEFHDRWSWQATRKSDCVILNETNSTLMLSTGIKDKNGNEIFEGDLIANFSWRWQIIWKEGGFYCKNRDTCRFPNLLALQWTENTVIIGNIHQNSNLLMAVGGALL